MSRFRAASRSALVVGVAAWLLSWALQAFAAADIVHIAAVGWWSKRPGASATVGDGSFEIASGIDGPESVAAFRILVTGSVTKATLVLTEASNPLTFVPKLQACPTDTPWVLPTNPGNYADAPHAACDRLSIPLTRDPAKAIWTGDVTGVVGGALSETSLMVVPAPDATLPVPPTFFIDFAAPRVDADGTPDVTTTTQAAAPAPPVTASAAPRPPSVGTHATAPTTAPAPATTAVTQPVARPTTPARFTVPSTHRHKPWGKLGWIIPLTAAIAFGYTYARKTLAERGLVPQGAT